MSVTRPIRLRQANPKWRAKRTRVDGILFDSKREAKRYGELKLRERAGEITGLRVHQRFPIVLNGVEICTYEADFSYYTPFMNRAVEDVKSPMSRTPVYRLKRKLVEALYGIVIREVE